MSYKNSSHVFYGCSCCCCIKKETTLYNLSTSHKKLLQNNNKKSFFNIIVVPCSTRKQPSKYHIITACVYPIRVLDVEQFQRTFIVKPFLSFISHIFITYLTTTTEKWDIKSQRQAVWSVSVHKDGIISRYW